MRHTNTTPDDWFTRTSLQNSLDQFWNLIENHYEEEWQIEADGSLVLEVDSAMLERVLTDNYSQAWFSWGTYMGGQTAGGEEYLLCRPENLKGTYRIKGVYDASQRLVNGERTYFFSQEF